MSKGRFTDDDWSKYRSTVAHKTVDEVFERSTIKSTKDPRTSFDPKTIGMRESRDSEAYPFATPVILAFDVTGSMGDIPHYFVQEGLGSLMKEVFDRKPVSDPQIMCMAVGDSYFDRAPLQATQFEVDISIATQLQDLYLEGGGGNNPGESYHLPWLFAALKTSTDSYEKRGKKGVLFTIGDEPPLPTVKKEHAKKYLGIDLQSDLSSEAVLEMVRRQYDVFHIIIEQGRGMSREVVDDWNKLLGQGYVLRLSDYTKLSEVVISALQVNAGADVDAVVSSWSGSTSLVVADAIKNTVAKAGRPGDKAIGPVKLLGGTLDAA